jgi:2-C-methyl-D-erythritol 4-phosphate cytidylyltransferase
MMEHVTAVIVAGGRGLRFGADKLLARLGEDSVLDRSLSAFQSHPRVSEIVLVLRPGLEAGAWAERYAKVKAVVEGGAERQDSVRNGCAAAAGKEDGLLLIHDAVRPLVSRELIDRVIEAAREHGAAAPVLPIEDTLKTMEGNRITGTADRRELARVQTPQGFRRALLENALRRAARDHFRGTDEASLVERMGRAVAAVPGERRNLKITTPEDLSFAEAWIEIEDRHRV